MEKKLHGFDFRDVDNKVLHSFEFEEGQKSHTFTLTGGDASSCNVYSNGYSYGNSQNVTTVINKIMVNVGDVKEYEQHGAMPSPLYPSEVRNCGDNINYLDNSLIVIGTVNDVVGSEPNWSSNGSRAKFPTLQLLPNGNTFTISCDENYNIAMSEYGEDNLCIKTSAWYTSYTFTKQANTTKISIKFKKVDNTAFTQEELTDIKCKLEKGSKKTGYSPYNCGCIDLKITNEDNSEEQTVTFPLSQGQVLHDEDVLADDGIHHKRKTIALNGTEQWQYMNGVFRLLNNDLIFENSSLETLMCTHYKARSPYETINLNTDNSICTSISYWGSAYKSFVINDKRFTNANEFKAYLAEQKTANTPVTVELNIQDEEIEAYTEEQQETYNKIKELYSYEGVTYITCEDEIKTTQEVIYRKDFTLAQNNLQKQIDEIKASMASEVSN